MTRCAGTTELGGGRKGCQGSAQRRQRRSGSGWGWWTWRVVGDRCRRCAQRAICESGGSALGVAYRPLFVRVDVSVDVHGLRCSIVWCSRVRDVTGDKARDETGTRQKGHGNRTHVFGVIRAAKAEHYQEPHIWYRPASPHHPAGKRPSLASTVDRQHTRDSTRSLQSHDIITLQIR